MAERKEGDWFDRYDSAPQWPWVVAILLLFAYGLWKGA